MSYQIVAKDHILDSTILRRMHQAALDILARTGVAVEHEGIRTAIAGRKGFQLKDGRLLVAADRVEAWRSDRRRLATQKDSCIDVNAKPFGFTCTVSDRPTLIVDVDGTTIRPMTRADVIAGAKLVNVLNAQGVFGSTPGIPQDVPIALQPLEQFMIGAEYSRNGGATAQITDIQTAGTIREMSKVYGRDFVQTIWCPSPLIFGGPELDIFWHFRGEIRRAGVGSMPIMGLTAPCDPIATFTLAIAECLAGAAILHELLPDLPVAIYPHPEPADMRTGAIVFGTPEWDLLDLMHRDVYAYYGQERAIKLLLTSAPLPNAQAMIEHSISAMTGMLSGLRLLGPIGQLALDEVYSPAMLIMDIDILRHAERLARGVESGEGLDLPALPGIIDSAVRDKILFAEHQSTVANLRQQYFQPAVLKRAARGAWENAGRPDTVRDAYAESLRLSAMFDYEPPREILSELRKIYARAKNTA